MSELSDFFLERVEFYGSLFFNSLTPEFLLVPELDMTRLGYQFFVGVVLMTGFAGLVIFLVDRATMKRELMESQQTKRSINSIRAAALDGPPSVSTPALEVMRARQKQQRQASKGSAYTPMPISEDHLPQFFKSRP